MELGINIQNYDDAVLSITSENTTITENYEHFYGYNRYIKIISESLELVEKIYDFAPSDVKEKIKNTIENFSLDL